MKSIIIFAIAFVTTQSFAATLSIPNSFSSGSATSASEMNSNFTAVKSAVDDNYSRIISLESSISGGLTRGKFLGFSTGSTDGSAGVKAMIQACNTTYSGSHICRYRDYLDSNMNGTESASGTAWIFKDTTSGVTSNSCLGWSSNGAPSSGSDNNTGFFINSLGQHSYTQSYSGTGVWGDCSVSRKIACCR